MNKTTSGDQSNLLTNRDDENDLPSPAIKDPNEEAKKKQRMKCIAIVAGIVIAIAILVVILVLVLKKSSSPDNPGDNPGTNAQNPYKVSTYVQNSHGSFVSYLQRDKSVAITTALQKGGNEFLENVTAAASLLSYSTAQVSVYNTSDYNSTYHVPTSQLASDYEENFNKGLLFNNVGWKFKNKGFGFSLYDKHTMEEYVSTEGMPFLAMKYYMQMGFRIESQKLFGLGERTSDFVLQPGEYILYPQVNAGKVDEGKNKEPTQQAGMHPFIMGQLNTTETFFGMYVMNSNAQSFKIEHETKQVKDQFNDTVTKHYSKVTFTSNGGSIDVFFFLGPRYNDVLKQYHALIGKPKLGPMMYHGLYLSNDDAFGTLETLDKTITTFASNNVSLDGVVISPTSVTDQYSFNIQIDTIKSLTDLKAAYPKMKWIFPFSPLVAKTYPKVSTLTDKYLLVTVADEPVKVTESVGGIGYCFDYFNPNAAQFIEQILTESSFDVSNTGFWLYHSLPTFTQTEYNSTKAPSDPFANLPYNPGQPATYKGSLPKFAEHHTRIDGDEVDTTYHFYLHGDHGAQMAQTFQRAASPTPNMPSALIISENTFPGAGAHAIGHVFPKLDLVNTTLAYAVTQILNFHMFGVPYASPNFCGYGWPLVPTVEQEKLCMRSFQISFISPLAVMNTDGPFLQDMQEQTMRAIRYNLEARMSYVIYQRTEMYKNSIAGGALVRPMFAEYPQDPHFNATMVDTVMFGEALKVDFQFDTDDANKDVLFPLFTNWLEVFFQELIVIEDDPVKIQSAPFNYPMVYQKEGTIVPFQHIIKTGARSTMGLKDTAVRFTVFLDQTTKDAKGHALIEDQQGTQEFYEIRATREVISFKQQNEGTIAEGAANKNIEMIRVAAAPLTFSTSNSACAVLNDYVTVQELHVTTYSNEQMEITPNDPKNPDDKSTLELGKVAFVFYGHNTDPFFKCDQSLMNGKVKQSVFNTTTLKEIVISQNINKLVSNASDINCAIEIEDDNTLYISWFPQSQMELARKLRVENVNPKVTADEINIDDYVYVNQDPFYIEVHAYQDTSNVFWSTKGTSFIFYEGMSMYSWYQPNANGDRFFGIGERKGEFYLQDNYMYSMHTNNQDLPDMVQNGRTMQFCKNGFFPIVFGKSQSSNDRLIATYMGEGSKDVLFQKKGPLGNPKVSVISMVDHATLRLIFDKEPLQLLRDTHRNLYNPETLRIPPDYALGQFHMVRGFEDSSVFMDVANFYMNIDWPLEGFFLDLSFTGYESLHLGAGKMSGGNANHTAQWIHNRNLTLFQIMKAGIPYNSDPANKLIAANAAIDFGEYRIQTQVPIVGQDQQGDVIYADYYGTDASLTQYLEGVMSHYHTTYMPHNFAVQLIHNEIYEPYCTVDCFHSNQYDPTPDHFYKAGVNQMLRNSLNSNSKKNVDTHNGYGYRQQLRLHKGDFKTKKFFASSSNTPASGKFGNVGRIIDYLGPHDDAERAVVALQSLSILGMGPIGEQFSNKDAKVGDTFVYQHMVIQTFSPLSAHQWHEDFDDKNIDEINAGSLIRYKYSMIKYTQALLFRQAYMGDPVIRPVFVDYYQDDATWAADVIDNQYLYGHFMVSIKGFQKGESTYFPAGTWCSINNPHADPQCFTTTGEPKTLQQRLFYFSDASILPLQDAFGLTLDTHRPVNNTHDLQDYPIDLHINPRLDGVLHSQGAFLYYDNVDDDLPHCFVEIIHNGAFINFQMRVGRDINECQYHGYLVGRIYIYNPSVFPFTQAKVNDNDALIVSIKPGNADYKYFDLTRLLDAGRLSWYDIYSIEFM